MTKQRNKTQTADASAGQPVGGDELSALRERVDELEAALTDARETKQRSLADFLNYQKRAMLNERLARQEGAGGVVESLLPVADFLDMALGHDPEAVSAQMVMEGVEMIRQELHKVFCEHGVTLIDPKLGDEPDPARHSAMGHAPATGVAPGLISRVEQPGYEVNGRVLRPATVFLAPPLSDTDENEEDVTDADV